MLCSFGIKRNDFVKRLNKKEAFLGAASRLKESITQTSSRMKTSQTIGSKGETAGVHDISPPTKSKEEKEAEAKEVSISLPQEIGKYGIFCLDRHPSCRNM